MPLSSIYATYDWKNNRGLEQYQYCPRCATPLASGLVAHKTRPLCPQCGFVYFRNPAPAISILVIQDGQALLGKRLGEPGQGKWALPSGYIEFEDDFITAARREVQEETGLEVQVEAILHVQSAFMPPQFHFLGIYVLARASGGQLRAGDDLEEVGWFPMAGPLPEMAFDSDSELIRAYRDQAVEKLPVRSA